MDNCGVIANVGIRNTSGGWSSFTSVCEDLGFPLDQVIEGNPVGAYKYKVYKYRSGSSDFIKCTANCASMLIANYASWGFPEAGHFFSCAYYTGKYGGPEYMIRHDPDSVPWFRSAAGSPFMGIKRSTWGCP